MTLPKLMLPTYDLILPIEKTKIKFRPFSVKEQKILLLALESEDKEFTEENIKQILKNCCLSFDVDIDSLSMIDIQFFFINLRARSVGEVIESTYRCQKTLEEGNVCNNSMKVEYNLLEINLEDKEFDPIIKLTSTIGMKMKLPDYLAIKQLESTDSIVEVTFDLIISCIDYIYDDEEIYKAKEVKKAELREFVENLSIEQFKKIEEFFKTIPKLHKVLNVKCSKCGFNHTIKIEGLENFFG